MPVRRPTVWLAFCFKYPLLAARLVSNDTLYHFAQSPTRDCPSVASKDKCTPSVLVRTISWMQTSRASCQRPHDPRPARLRQSLVGAVKRNGEWVAVPMCLDEPANLVGSLRRGFERT